MGEINAETSREEAPTEPGGMGGDLRAVQLERDDGDGVLPSREDREDNLREVEEENGPTVEDRGRRPGVRGVACAASSGVGLDDDAIVTICGRAGALASGWRRSSLEAVARVVGRRTASHLRLQRAD